MLETWVRSLIHEDSLEEGIAIHSSILPENSMDRGAWKAQKELDTTEQLNTTRTKIFVYYPLAHMFSECIWKIVLH